jgi:hypothetical protein
MRQLTITILLLVTMLRQSSFASDEVMVGKGKSTFIIKPDTASTCHVTTIERYTRYLLFEYDYDKKLSYLITQGFEVGEGCFEGNDPANVNVTAKMINVENGHVSDKTVWSFSTRGNSGGKAEFPLEGVYMVTYPGCCGAANTAKYFSLFSGKFLGAATLDPLKIEIPNTPKVRYIFAQDQRASDYMGKKPGAATIFYSDKDNRRQELVVTVPGSRDTLCMLTGLRFGRSNDKDRLYSLWKKLSFDGVSIVAELECEKAGAISMEIPLIADRLSSTKAKIKGIPGIKVEDVTSTIQSQRSSDKTRRTSREK